VEDFVDFLFQRDTDRQLVRAVVAASEPAFAKVCDNPEDDVHYTVFAATIGKLGRQLLTSTP
jgi:hypothetical protein